MKRLLIVLASLLLVALIWLLTTENSWVWPRRNYFQYQLLSRWWHLVGEPQAGPPGALRGVLKDSQGEAIAGGWVLLSRWDGTTYAARSDDTGAYTITDIPAGKYWPVASAPGYDYAIAGKNGRGVRIPAGETQTTDVTLTAETPRLLAPGKDLVLSEPETVSCTTPFDASARRQTVTFDNAGQPNQLTFLYSPPEAPAGEQYPLLLTVYPGPADTWECASTPLAAAGYALLAIGPAYSLDLDPDVDELERLLDFAQANQFPQVNPAKVAILGGSYSGLHVQLLMRREREDIQGAVLMGAPTDLFAMRHHLEARTFIPPFGLDQAFLALGLPDRQPLRYWHGSGAYHIRSTMPPILIFHSHADAVIPIDQSELLATRLAEAGVPHQAHYFEGAGHYLLSSGGEAQEVYDLTVAFLEEHLK